MGNPELHVFLCSDGVDLVVARDPEDAMTVWVQHSGERPEDYPGKIFELQADGDFLSLSSEDDHGEWSQDRKTHAEWAHENGRGVLASTQY